MDIKKVIEPSPATLKMAGTHAWEYFVDTGECLFCTLDENEGQHENFCPFFGLGRDSK
jgi:hypothetical protein